MPIPQAATRRKSSTWKTFNLKRQLSKVDMKLKKNTFTTCDNLREKRNSVFYCSDTSPNPDNEDTLEERSSPESDDNTIIEKPNNNNDDDDREDKTSKEFDCLEEYSADIEYLSGEEQSSVLVGSLGSQYEMPINKQNYCVLRPDKLELDECPVRPPRHIKKRTPDKRDQRLLSVPNIKLQKPDLQHLRDLRYKEGAQSSTQSSFAGNLMRRFSKS